MNSAVLHKSIRVHTNMYFIMHSFLGQFQYQRTHLKRKVTLVICNNRGTLLSTDKQVTLTSITRMILIWNWHRVSGPWCVLIHNIFIVCKVCLAEANFNDIVVFCR